MGTRGRSRRRARPRPGPNGRPPERDGENGQREQVPELTELSPFSVFCALHLGITPTDGYASQTIDSVAGRFGMTPDSLRTFLQRHRLREPDLRAVSFDLASAQLDIQVAPEGISRTELARTLFAELKASLPDPGPVTDGLDD
jgi:hypothetical protein